MTIDIRPFEGGILIFWFYLLLFIKLIFINSLSLFLMFPSCNFLKQFFIRLVFLNYIRTQSLIDMKNILWIVEITKVLEMHPINDSRTRYTFDSK